MQLKETNLVIGDMIAMKDTDHILAEKRNADTRFFSFILLLLEHVYES